MAVGNPVFVHFNEPADTLQQLLLVKVLGGSRRSQGSGFAQPPSTLSPSRADWTLTGKQRRLAERSILSKLSHGRKRRTCWSLPLYAFRPSKSCGDRRGRDAQGWVPQYPHSKRQMETEKGRLTETKAWRLQKAQAKQPWRSSLFTQLRRRRTAGGAWPIG